MLDSSS